MRKKLSLLALLVLLAAGSAHAYDFSAVTSSGHTLYYNIVSSGVVVTYPYMDYNPWYNNTKPTGALVIDSTVNRGGTTYSVTSIGSDAFYECTGLTSVTIPTSVTSIGESAFDGCTSLTSVTIPNSVTSIGTYAFWNCTGLTSIIIPNSVTSIGEGAFSRCTGLTSVTIPNSVTSIGNQAFRECSSLIAIAIPNSVTSIGDYAFGGCTGLTSLVFNATNCTSAGSSAYPVFSSCPITSVTFGSNVQNIPNYLLSNCTSLTSVTIPNSVTSIGNYAFRGCSSLIAIAIPNSTTEIGASAFEGCTSLTSANIGDGVTTMGNAAFLGCLRLTSVSFGEGVVNIGSQAFKDCGIIGELVIPQSVTTIGNEGFRNCYGINEITCLGRVAPSLGNDVFLGLDTSITVNIPCGTMNLYAGRWPYFHNFNEIPFLFNVASDNLAYGTVQMLQEPSCDDPVAIVKATARTGYHFDHWSDGSTQNPYTCVVTGSMTLTAFFSSDNGQTGIETADGEADGPNVYADGGKIVVTDAEGEEVCLYDMMGRLLATRQGEDIHFDVPAAGAYLVRVGNHPARRIVIVR